VRGGGGSEGAEAASARFGAGPLREMAGGRALLAVLAVLIAASAQHLKREGRDGGAVGRDGKRRRRRWWW